MLPSGKLLNNTSNESRIRLSASGKLSILHVKAKDAGTYSCIATNSLGQDMVTFVLHVHNKNIHILHKGIATNFITVTWNGTDSTVLSSDYLILYRRHGSNKDYGRVHLRPYMRTYTITGLSPDTLYEFCIAYNHMDTVYKLHCMDIRTKHYMAKMHGIHTFSSLSILSIIVLIIAFVAFVCICGVFVKRYIRRKSYEEPDIHNIVTEIRPKSSKRDTKTVNKMSQIPLDNLYSPASTSLSTSRTSLPSSTPLCTSRTSLISNSKA